MKQTIDIGQVDDHVSNVLARIEQEEQHLREQRETLAERFIRLQKERTIAGAPVDDVTLREFLAKPYVVRPLGGDKYELIVPKFIGLRGGWALRTDGAFSVYLVTRFIHLISPLPDWLAGDLNYQAAPYRATLDGNTLVVEKGKASEIATNLGRAVARVDGNRVHLKPASRFDVIRQLIREYGILPYAPTPIPQNLRRDPEHYIARDENGKPMLELRPHQRKTFDEFMKFGHIAIFAWGQTGKSFVVLQALAELRGKKLILCPTRALVDSWIRFKLPLLTPEAQAEVTVSTYHNLDKYQKNEWSLVVPDEAQHLPANLFIEAATLKTSSLIGLSATPVREDGNEDLIPALCGFPTGTDWPVSETQRPNVYVHIVKDENTKLAMCARLTEKKIAGKTLIFTYRLDIGKRVSTQLDIPFAYGGTSKPLDLIADNDTVVVSKIADVGLSFPIDRIIEIDFQFGSRMEAGQRLLRAAYDTGRKSEYHVLMTRHEFENYAKRLLIYEQWGLDVQIVESEGGTSISVRTPMVRATTHKPRTVRTPRSTIARAPAQLIEPEPKDESAIIMALPSVAVKIAQAEKNIGERTAPYVRMAFRFYHKAGDASLSPTDIADARGIRDQATRSRLSSACKALAQCGLLVVADAKSKRYQINPDEIGRAQALSKLVK